MTSYVMFALSLTICEVFAKQEKCQNFDLENEDQGQGGEKRDLQHLTTNVRLHTSDFF